MAATDLWLDSWPAGFHVFLLGLALEAGPGVEAGPSAASAFCFFLDGGTSMSGVTSMSGALPWKG